MEIIEIRSAHSLVTRLTDRRPVGEHSYQLNCRHFTTEYNYWRKNSATQKHVLELMTLSFEQIFITEAESGQVAEAIQAVRSAIKVD